MRRDPRTNTFTGYTEAELRAEYADTTTDEGIPRWTSNHAVPHEDVLTDWQELGLIPPITVAAALAARRLDLDAFAQRYREQMAARTPQQIAEQRAEARGAFGPGVALVNVLTGERYTI